MTPILLYTFLAVLALTIILLCIYAIYVRHVHTHLIPLRNFMDIKQKIHDKMLEFGTIDYSHLTFGSLINVGPITRLYRGYFHSTPVAVKQVDTGEFGERPNEMRQLMTEIDMMRKLRHPSLTMLMGLCIHSPHFYIITEYVSRGSLFYLLHPKYATQQSSHLQRDQNNPQLINWRRSIDIAIDIAQGLLYLHSHTPSPILHRNLKSLNILIDENYRAKVSDFGLTPLHADHTQQHEIQYSSPLWMSPEMLRHSVYTEKSDVFSFGIILYELYTHEIPYSSYNLSTSQLVNKILHVNLRPALPKTTPKPLLKLLMKCWHPVPERRPDFNQILRVLEGFEKDVTIINHVPEYEEREALQVAAQRRNSVGSSAMSPLPDITSPPQKTMIIRAEDEDENNDDNQKLKLLTSPQITNRPLASSTLLTFIPFTQIDILEYSMTYSKRHHRPLSPNRDKLSIDKYKYLIYNPNLNVHNEPTLVDPPPPPPSPPTLPPPSQPERKENHKDQDQEEEDEEEDEEDDEDEEDEESEDDGGTGLTDDEKASSHPRPSAIFVLPSVRMSHHDSTSPSSANSNPSLSPSNHQTTTQQSNKHSHSDNNPETGSLAKKKNSGDVSFYAHQYNGHYIARYQHQLICVKKCRLPPQFYSRFMEFVNLKEHRQDIAGKWESEIKLYNYLVFLLRIPPSPHLIPLIGISHDDSTHSLFLMKQYATRGRLMDIIASPTIAITYDTILQFMIDICKAMEFLLSQSPPILPSSLTLSQLLLDDSYKICLTNWEFVDLYINYICNVPLRPSEYSSPEQLQDPSVLTSSSLVYSFGIIICALLNRRATPYTQKFNRILAYDIVMNQVRPNIIRRDEEDHAKPKSNHPSSLDGSTEATQLKETSDSDSDSDSAHDIASTSLPPISPELLDLLARCLDADPLIRPSFSHLSEEFQRLRVSGIPRILLVNGVDGVKLYRKSLTVIAFPSKDSITVLKEWGKSTGSENSYLICSGDDDLYMCSKDVFESTYERVDPGASVSTATPVPPQYRKIGQVLAKSMSHDFSIRSATGSVEHGAANDYLLQNVETGDQWTVKKHIFESLYEEVQH